MVSIDEVERQLKQIGANFRHWGRSEIRELKLILVPGERIQGCLNGRYAGGFALLCATDQRLLLVDKKPMYLTLEDIRYDMIAEVDYSHRVFDATIKVLTPNKTLTFTAMKRADLRAMTVYMQHRVMEIRQHQALIDAHLGHSEQQSVQPQSPQIAPTSQPTTYTVSLQDPRVGSIEGLPLPRFQNPYTNQSLMVRKRTSPFTH